MRQVPTPVSFSPPRAGPLMRVLHGAVARWYLRKPELTDLLAIKFPDVSSVGAAAANEVAYRLRRRRTYRVLSLNIETTNHCNLSCTICPVNRGMVREKQYLDPALFERLVEQTPSLRFVLPFQWGEPLLHPELDRMVRFATDRGVRSMLTTNGTLLDDDWIARLLRSGLTRLTVSVDGDAVTHERIRGVPLEDLRQRVVALRQARDRARSPLAIDVSMVLDESTRPAIDHYRSQWTGLADRVQVIPRLAEGPRRHPCRELWRGSLVVLVDGTVTACCADSEGALALGHVDEATPTAILNSERFQAVRRQHAAREFPSPCATCSEVCGKDVGVSPRFGS